MSLKASTWHSFVMLKNSHKAQTALICVLYSHSAGMYTTTVDTLNNCKERNIIH